MTISYPYLNKSTFTATMVFKKQIMTLIMALSCCVFSHLSNAQESKIEEVEHDKINSQRKDRGNLFINLQTSANQGDAKAQYKLGVMYANGDGVAKNERAAIQWYGKAAEQGDAKAQYKLGVMYEQGNGVSENQRKAAELYQKAAEQGDAKAQYKLGIMYEQGNTVSENQRTAAEWYRKAAEQGDAAAQYKLGVMYAKGEGVPENQDLAAKWLTKVAEQINLGNWQPPK